MVFLLFWVFCFFVVVGVRLIFWLELSSVKLAQNVGIEIKVMFGLIENEINKRNRKTKFKRKKICIFGWFIGKLPKNIFKNEKN